MRRNWNEYQRSREGSKIIHVRKPRKEVQEEALRKLNVDILVLRGRQEERLVP